MAEQQTQRYLSSFVKQSFFQNFAKCSGLICWISLPPTFGTFIAKKKGKFANFRAFRYFKTRARISKRFYSSSANGEAEEQMD